MKKKGRGRAEAKKKISKKSLPVILTALIVSLSLSISIAAAEPGNVTTFTITPETDIANVTSAYKATVNTTGFTSLNITIPAGFEAVTPTTGNQEIAMVDFYNASGWYGNVTIWSGDIFGGNLSAKVSIDGYNRSEVYSGAKIDFNVNYSAGGKTVIPSPFGTTHPDVINLTLPTDSVNGSLNISLPASITLTNATINIRQFVKNPSAPGDYTFTAKANGELEGKTETVVIKPAPTPTPRPHRGGRGTPRDSDDDGLSDIDELLKYKTDPYNLDTDGGGVDDATEIARGTNPLDPTDDVMPTPSPTPSPTPTPTPTPTLPLETPTPTPSPTPKPLIPGFEAVFAIAGLLAVAYLVLRSKK